MIIRTLLTCSQARLQVSACSQRLIQRLPLCLSLLLLLLLLQPLSLSLVLLFLLPASQIQLLPNLLLLGFAANVRASYA